MNQALQVVSTVNKTQNMMGMLDLRADWFRFLIFIAFVFVHGALLIVTYIIRRYKYIHIINSIYYSLPCKQYLPCVGKHVEGCEIHHHTDVKLTAVEGVVSFGTIMTFLSVSGYV